MKLRNAVASGVKWQAINITGRYALGLVVFTVLTRLLSPSDFGLIAIITTYLFFVGIVSDQGLGTAIIKQEPLSDDHLHSAFWFGLIASLVLFVTTLLAAPMIARLLAQPDLKPLLQWSSPILIINALAAVQNVLFIRKMAFRTVATRALTANILGGATGLIAAFSGAGVWALVAQQIAISLGAAIFLWISSSYRPRLSLSTPHLLELMKTGAPVCANSILWSISSRLEQLVLGRYFGPAVLGIYVVGGKLPELARTITQYPLADISLPAMSSLQNDRQKLVEAVRKGMELNALISIPIFVILAVSSRDLVPLLFGSQWTAAAPICSVLSIYAMVGVLQVFVYPCMVASGSANRFVLLNAGSLILVILSCFAGYAFGIYVLMYCLIGSSIAVWFVALMHLHRRIGLHPITYLRPCLAPLLSSALAALIYMTLYLKLDSIAAIFRLLSCGFVSTLVYTALAYLLNRKALGALLLMLQSAMLPSSK